MGRRIKEENAIPNFITGNFCIECGEPQFDAPDGAGIVCMNGHGGVDAVGAKDAEEIRTRLTRIAVETTSAALEKASEKAAIEEKQRVARSRIVFGSANAGKKTPMSEGFARIVERIYIDHPEDAFDRLVKGLKLGEKRADYGSVIKAVDEAEDNAREAHALYVTALRDRESYEKCNEHLFGVMRLEATAVLQKEKDNKERNKTITNADVDAMCAVLFGDEWMKQEIERNNFKRAEDTVKNLSERWDSRCRSLQTLASKLR